MEKLIVASLACSTQKRSGNHDFRRFPPMLNWWVDISLRFTQNKHFMYTVANSIPNVLLHPQFVGTTDSAGFSVSDRQIRFWRFSPFFHSSRHRIWWWPHPNNGRLPTTRRYCRFGRFSGSDRQTRFWRLSSHFHLNCHRIFTQATGLTLCAFNALLALVILVQRWFLVISVRSTGVALVKKASLRKYKL